MNRIMYTGKIQLPPKPATLVDALDLLLGKIDKILDGGEWTLGQVYYCPVCLFYERDRIETKISELVWLCAPCPFGKHNSHLGCYEYQPPRATETYESIKNKANACGVTADTLAWLICARADLQCMRDRMKANS